MHKRICIMIVVFLSFASLWAQVSGRTLIINEFTGGPRNDARGIADAIANQNVIRENFTIVSTGTAVFAINGTFQREGVGYKIDITVSRGTRVLTRETMSFNDIMEVNGYIPSIAARLAMAANPRITVDYALIPLPGENATIFTPTEITFHTNEIPDSHLGRPEQGQPPLLEHVSR